MTWLDLLMLCRGFYPQILYNLADFLEDEKTLREVWLGTAPTPSTSQVTNMLTFHSLQVTIKTNLLAEFKHQALN